MDINTQAPGPSGAFSEIFWRVSVPAAWDGQPLDRFLREALGLSRSYIAHLKFRPEGILLGALPVHTDHLLRGGEALCLSIGDREGNPARPLEAPFELLWEDEFLAVLNKAPGLAVHGPDREGLPATLQNAAAFHWGPDVPFHPVQRLDRGTSGLMLLAKCRLAHERLQAQLHSERFSRDYLALAAGRPEPPEGSIELPIAPAGTRDHRRIIAPEGQSARTDYRLLAESDRAALLSLRLHTGRTHQIRVHLAALGCPLLGDKLYGGPAVPGLAHPALHSHRLALRHPFTGEELHFTAPPPDDLQALMTQFGLTE